ncbi:MAG TPA: hypothetical protein VFW24_17520 [Acidimicrobiales bacterium]|nr:hypothetical protein [Acidimicrobiales bacterium]
MSGRFVDECRKEWKRLGVPDAAAEEMAADLTADLTEAAAEGAAPEEVLGNGVFNARAFAASRATARGVASPGRYLVSTARRSPWVLAGGSLASLFVAVVGLAIAASGHASTSLAMARRSINLPIPALVPGPRQFTIVGPLGPARAVFLDNGPLHVLGFVLLVVGVAGLGLTLWLWRRWRPCSVHQHRSGPDDSVALPSYL